MKEMQADYRIRQNQTRQEEKDCILHSESGFNALRSTVFFYKKANLYLLIILSVNRVNALLIRTKKRFVYIRCRALFFVSVLKTAETLG